MYGPLADTAFAPLAVHTGDDVLFAAQSKADTGLTSPMLIDYDDQLLFDYRRPGDAEVLFPLAYLVDENGIISNIYVDEEPALSALLAEIQALQQ